MNRSLVSNRERSQRRPSRKSSAWLRCLGAAATIALSAGAALAVPVGIQGTLSNFDCFNETGIPVYGAELELDGLHSSDVTQTFPSHFNSMVKTEYTNGSTFGTRLTFTGYNFDPSGFIIPVVGQTTNGHFAVNVPGAEHFGFSAITQPTASRFLWLDQGNQTVGTTPLSIPLTTWTYNPPAAGQPAHVAAVVAPPQPEIPEPQLPDSIWMKVYVTELDREVGLMELMSGPGIVPQNAGEVETEWALLEGGVPDQADANIADNTVAVIRRYEYFKYTGAYDPEDHSPLSAFVSGDPPPNELGEFIAANMVAINLGNGQPVVPEPASMMLLSGVGLAAWLRRPGHRKTRGV